MKTLRRRKNNRFVGRSLCLFRNGTLDPLSTVDKNRCADITHFALFVVRPFCVLRSLLLLLR